MRVLVIALAVLALAVATLATKEENAADLRAQAQAAPVDHQPDLYLRAAKLQLKTADGLYTEGKVDEAKAALDLLSSDSDKATDAAVRSRKHLKNTEIEIRKMSERLHDMKGTLNFEDQAPVQAVVDHLESLRTNLLNHMFGKGK